MLSLSDLKHLRTGDLSVVLTESTYYKLCMVLHINKSITYIQYVIRPKIKGLPGSFVTREYSSVLSMYERTVEALDLALQAGMTIELLVDSAKSSII